MLSLVADCRLTPIFVKVSIFPLNTEFTVPPSRSVAIMIARRTGMAEFFSI